MKLWNSSFLSYLSRVNPPFHTMKSTQLQSIQVVDFMELLQIGGEVDLQSCGLACGGFIHKCVYSGFCEGHAVD